MGNYSFYIVQYDIPIFVVSDLAFQLGQHDGYPVVIVVRVFLGRTQATKHVPKLKTEIQLW